MSQIPINQLPGVGTGLYNFSPDSSLSEGSELSQASAADKAAGPLQLSAWQSISQPLLKLTGQLNDKGDANGPGFMHSKLITYVEYAGIGVLVLGGLYLLGPVFTFGAAALSSKR